MCMETMTRFFSRELTSHPTLSVNRVARLAALHIETASNLLVVNEVGKGGSRPDVEKPLLRSVKF